MKPFASCCAILACMVGCEGVRQADMNVSPVTSVDERHDEELLDAAPTETDLASDDGEAIDFELSAEAATHVRAAIDASPGATHLVVEVHVDDKRFGYGLHYQMTVGPQPSRERYALTESHGIPLAIEKDDLQLLHGTRVDYFKLENGVEGVLFRNPNQMRPAATSASDEPESASEPDAANASPTEAPPASESP